MQMMTMTDRTRIERGEIARKTQTYTAVKRTAADKIDFQRVLRRDRGAPAVHRQLQDQLEDVEAEEDALCQVSLVSCAEVFSA
jgi:hypothetical protein